jgi:hypothetical protein
MRADISRRGVLWASLAAAVVLFILPCIAYADRPVADFAHAAFGGTRLFRISIAILASLRALLVPMGLFVVGCGAWRLAGRRLPGWTKPFLKAALAAGIAGVVIIALKAAIGRSEPYPFYVLSRIHEFRPMRGGSSHRAFPSGTMGVASAFLAVLCLESTGRRWFAGTVLTLIAGCLIVTNSHWLADILGGLCLGTGVGWRLLWASGGVIVQIRGENEP